jgi:hypothetical protein
MTKHKNVTVLTAAVVVCACIVCAVTSSRGQEHDFHNNGRTYQFDGDVTLPEYKSDIDKLIDAYERMFDRLLYSMGTVPQSNMDVNSLNKQLSAIDYKLNILNARMARIEESLGKEKQSKQIKQIITNEANDINDNMNLSKSMD